MEAKSVLRCHWTWKSQATCPPLPVLTHECVVLFVPPKHCRSPGASLRQTSQSSFNLTVVCRHSRVNAEHPVEPSETSWNQMPNLPLVSNTKPQTSLFTRLYHFRSSAFLVVLQWAKVNLFFMRYHWPIKSTFSLELDIRVLEPLVINIDNHCSTFLNVPI